MTKNRWIFSGLAISFVITMMILIPLRAADTDKNGEKKPFSNVDEETLKLVKTIQVWKLVTDVSLSEEQLVSFLPVLRRQDRLRWNFWHERRDAIEKLKKLDQNNASEAQLKQALEEYNDLEEEFDKKEEELEKKLMSKLTLKQKVKYILFKDSYWEDLKGTLRKIKELSKRKRQPKPLRQSKPKKGE